MVIKKKPHPKTTKQKQAKHLYIMSVLLKGLVPRVLKFIQPHFMLCYAPTVRKTNFRKVYEKKSQLISKYFPTASFKLTLQTRHRGSVYETIY